MRKTIAAGLATGTMLVVAVGAPARQRAPYDFTGRWDGTIAARGETFQATADLASTKAKRFAGRATVLGSTGPIPCGLRGKSTRRVRITFSCEDGTRGKLVGSLDVEQETIEGVAKLRDRRGRRARGEFALAKRNG
jgi:hypothetical protein